MASKKMSCAMPRGKGGEGAKGVKSAKQPPFMAKGGGDSAKAKPGANKGQMGGLPSMMSKKSAMAKAKAKK